MYSRDLNIFIMLISVYEVCSMELAQLMIDENSDKFGPYDVEWSRYETCKGPKSTNATNFETTLEKIGDAYYGVINFTFMSQVQLEEMKITVYTIKDNHKNILWNYKMKDLCQHYAFAASIEKLLNAKNCMVKKGFYTCTVNFTEVTETFFGKSFFFGEYMLKVTSWSKKGNVLCLVLNEIFKKKKK